jgi:hypothetical protein
MRYFFTIFFSLCIICLPACGVEEDEVVGDNLPSIIITSGGTLATTAINAESESTVIIINNDSEPHTITSQSADGAFDNTGDFDVIVPAGGKALLTLPAAAAGTVYSFYCRFHTNAQIPANGSITVE